MGCMGFTAWEGITNMKIETKVEPGFRITEGKGFHVTFENGYTVSVQFGYYNYCSNKSMQIGLENKAAGASGSPNAEVAWWGPDGNFIPFENDDVEGYKSPKEVLELLNRAASK